MNNCKNPLKLTYSPQLFVGYKVNKPNIENCELVDKEIADNMLNALIKIVKSFENDTQSWGDILLAKEAIKKATE